LRTSSLFEEAVLEPAAIQNFLADRCEHPFDVRGIKMRNPQHQAESEQEVPRDMRRLRRLLSPDLSEVLHMLDAFEARLGMKSTAS
jgi:hypothetical protein